MSHLGLPMTDEEHDGPRSRSHRAHKRRRRGWFAVLIACLALALVVAGVWFAIGGLGERVRSSLAGPADYPGPGTGSVQVQVQPGESAGAIGRTLKAADVVASVESFTTAARADERSKGIQPGYYVLKTKMSGQGALALMLDPASRLVTRVTVPEGLRLDETVKLLAAKAGFTVADLEKALADPAALGLPAEADGQAEGYLYPATYDVEPDDTPASVLKAMVAQYAKVAAAVGVEDGPVSAHEVVTIASIVEAEARHAEDYGKVARVIYNRLAKKMPLQMDSTVNYALKADKEIVTFDDLEVESDYNTYKHPGLPPGPIGSPGQAALEAALAPADGDWLYFVTVDPASGETKFTASYDEFLRFKQELKANS
ncbi:MAG TPA: endolytic transglycosylase MltG [Actinomycetes bacterium]|nr:endolytic transglycosylase MltG [Actinomycetes bacterium]